MSAPKFTPGPWAFEFNPKFDLHPRVMAQKGIDRICVASTIGTKTTRDKLMVEAKEANAHLIAAAPELLEALKAALPGVCEAELRGPNGEDVEDLIRAAIAKAEGGAA